MNPYDQDLGRNPANYQPLTPLTYLDRAAATFPDRIAHIHGDARVRYDAFYARCRQLASALSHAGIGKGDTVSVMLANTPPMLEAHYGVPMTQGVLHSINTRLDAATIAFMLDHAETKLLICDTEFAPVMREALGLAKVRPRIIDYADPVARPPHPGPRIRSGAGSLPQAGEGVTSRAASSPLPRAGEGGPEGRVRESSGDSLGDTDYETFVASGDPGFDWHMPDDEWDAISLNYTSGTTGNPKGVVYHHRGAALMGYANTIHSNMGRHPVYLWTLPMFHCNGWCFPWSLSVVAGTHVCLRAVRAPAMYAAIADHGVTHLSGAPIVMSTLLNAPPAERRDFSHKVEFLTAAAPPPEAVLAKMADAGFNVTHLYGLTETYGPATVNEWRADWEALDGPARATKKARQGVRYVALEGLTVMDPESMQETPRDGETIGEVMFRGNIVMKGYLKNAQATNDAFAGGWFHSGDLGVMHKDGYIQLKDRSKDIIISGGENISSIEVEDVLYKHPAISAAAVVAKDDDKWGETPCAFVEIAPGASVTEEEVIAWCRERLAKFKVPKNVVFTELPKTSTGKIQKFKLRELARGV